ncbi:MAG: glycosyltransferase, partial [Sinomicrobium sp.]|nr:glycosyltransferase [Sinomicrobium sp.]
MKIIIIGPAHPLRGGIADTNASLCRALSAENEVAIVSFTLQYPAFLFPGKTQRSTDPAPQDISITPMLNSVNPFNWIKAARKINKQNPDLVIFRYWIPFMAPCMGTLARRLKKQIPLIALCDNIIPHERRISDSILTRYFVKPFHGFVTLSRSVKSELKTFTAKPVITIPHPINDGPGGRISKEQARKQLKLDPEGNFILFFGLIRKYKGLDLILKALGDKKLRDLKVKLLIAGEFYDPPEAYSGIIEALGLHDRVIIRDEYIPASETGRYFSAADLVTQTYHTASQSGVTQLAFHFDCPILVTNVGGLSEVVTHEKTGYVTSKAPAEIAAHIAEFYENKRSAAFIKNIQKEKERYSWSAFACALTDFYEDVKPKAK